MKFPEVARRINVSSEQLLPAVMKQNADGSCVTESSEQEVPAVARRTSLSQTQCTALGMRGTTISWMHTKSGEGVKYAFD